MNEQDDALSFSHEAVDTTFIYDSCLLGKDEAFAGKKSGEYGTLADPRGGTDYARIGPFGTWSIAIPEHLLDGAAMRTLNDVLIDLYGST